MSNSYTSATFRLFKKRPSFFNGLTALFDLSPSQNKYHTHTSPAQADVEALRSDWFAIGKDLKDAIDQYDSKQAR